VDTELEGTDEVIQRQGWEQRPDGGWRYVGGDSGAALARKKRVKQIAKLMGISFQAALEYCDALDAS
jgi:hypothetical protein